MNIKISRLIPVFIFLSFNIQAQVSKKNNYPIKEDVETLDGIIKAYYDVISGPAGEPRDWERDKSLHHPNALVSVTGKENNKPFVVTQSLSDYHKSFGIPKTGFWEYEIKRETKKFGNITHVWSIYETKEEQDGPVTERGINSIQLYNDGTRWWILSWMFDSERNDNPIPKNN